MNKGFSFICTEVIKCDINIKIFQVLPNLSFSQTVYLKKNKLKAVGSLWLVRYPTYIFKPATEVWVNWIRIPLHLDYDSFYARKFRNSPEKYSLSFKYLFQLFF